MTEDPSVMEWAIWYDLPGFSPLTCIGVNRCLTHGMQQTLGVRFSKVHDVVYEKDHALILTPKDELDAIVRQLIARILDEPKWADTFNTRMMAASLSMLETSRKNAALAKSADDATLASFHETFVQQTDEMFRYGILPILAESNEGALSQAYYESVKDNVGEGNFAAVADLLAPVATSAPMLQHMDLLKIVLQKTEGRTQGASELDDAYARWSWVPYAFIGPAWTKEGFQKEFEGLSTKPVHEIRRELNELSARPDAVKHKREALMDKYGFDESRRQLTRTIADFAQTKYLRKENFTHAHFHYHTILSEMARRLGLSISQVRLLTPAETEAGLLKGDVPDLDERGRFVVYEHFDGNVRILKEDEARIVEKRIPRTDATGIESLQGQCACPGKAIGAATIVNTEKDMDKLKDGDVLFSYATTPELMAAIRRASAIVTDRGGVTCHAAIVSRELNIPCVIGTKVGTQWIRDGQHVEVDAAAGTVKKIS